MNTRVLSLLVIASLFPVTQSAMAQSRSTVKPPRASGTVTAETPAPPPPDPQNTLRTPVAGPKPPAPDPARPDTDADTGPVANGINAPASVNVDAARPERPETPAAKATRRELLVASTDVAEADQQRAWLTSQGAQLLRRRGLRNLGWVLSIYRLTPDATPAEVTKGLIAQWPDARPELNARYTALTGEATAAPLDYARTLIAWPPVCVSASDIAMLDGSVDQKLAAFSGRSLQVEVLTPPGVQPDYQHGTALAALLIGQAAPLGLLPKARLRVGSIMAEESGQAYTTTEWILRGLDWVVGLDPRPAALNLSFGGPRSVQIERALERVSTHTTVVAAAGNDGRRAPSYPAAYPGVIGVTALDAREHRWVRANTCDHVAIAAPGVDVWTLDAKGQGYYASGTSFAALFVSAAIAAGGAEKTTADWLAKHTRDIGTPGKDPEFGYGALSMRACP